MTRDEALQLACEDAGLKREVSYHNGLPPHPGWRISDREWVPEGSALLPSYAAELLVRKASDIGCDIGTPLVFFVFPSYPPDRCPSPEDEVGAWEESEPFDRILAALVALERMTLEEAQEVEL